MIVDSPGVGENEVMDKSVVNYMPNALCFIYVINSGNAGGVQEDRVSIRSLKNLNNSLRCSRPIMHVAICTLFIRRSHGDRWGATDIATLSPH